MVPAASLCESIQVCVCLCVDLLGLVSAGSPQKKRWTTLQINASNRSADSER